MIIFCKEIYLFLIFKIGPQRVYPRGQKKKHLALHPSKEKNNLEFQIQQTKRCTRNSSNSSYDPR